MSISECLKLVGDDRIKFQTLDSSAIGAQRTKSGDAKFSFLTSEAGVDYLLGNHEKLCLIVWVPRKKFEEVIEEGRKAQANA